MTFLKTALFAATLAVANLSYAADGSERSMHETLAQDGQRPDKASRVEATN